MSLKGFLSLAGPGYLYYPRLTAPTSAAVGLNVTCPPDDWAALLAAVGGSSNSSTGGALPALAPCGTATVSSGAQLLSALQALQPGHARVLLTLAANISLPASPTPQRAAPAPGDDDAVPLAVVYRNVTLVGAGYSPAASAAAGPVTVGLSERAPTELNFGMRRNALGMLAGWQQLLAQEPARAKQLPAADATSWRGRPVTVLADLALVNGPPGPIASWPMGLLGTFHHYAGMDRSGNAGLQLIALRSNMVFTPGALGYMSYWYRLTSSVLPEERANVAWLEAISEPPRRTVDADGVRSYMGRAGDYFIGFNSSATAAPLLTPAAVPEFDLWTPLPAGLLALPASGVAAASSPLPPSSFAVASNASQLLVLLQEPWTGGPRVILITANITLRQRSWPTYGAKLSYNVTLAGPTTGEAVQLDTAGLQLAQPAQGSVTDPGPLVVVQMARLTLLGLSPPLLLATWDDVTWAGAGLTGSLELLHWRDRCLAWDAGDGDGDGEASLVGESGEHVNAPERISWEVRDCTVFVSPGTMRLLHYYNNPAACPSSASPALLKAEPAAVVCPAARSTLPTTVDHLLNASLLLSGQFSVVGSANASMASINLSRVVIGPVTFAGSQAVVASAVDASWTGPPCGVEGLVPLLLPLMAPIISEATPSRGSSIGAGAIVGGAVGGGVGALCIAGVLAALVLRSRGRRRGQQLGFGAKQASAPAEMMSGGGAGGGGGNGDAPGSAGLPPLEGARSSARGTPVVMIACGDKSVGRERRSDNNFSASFFMQGGAAAASAAELGETMADAASLGPKAAATPAAATLPPVEDLEAYPYSAEEGQQRGAQRPATEAGVALPRRQSLEAAWGAGAAAGGAQNNRVDSGPRSRGSLRTTMADEIDTMLKKCQAAANAGSSSGARPRSKRMQLLGRGGYGAVYLGDWRGMPAAIKIMLLGPGESAARRERLAREVALTVTLNHPHVVPTYDFKLSVVRAESSDRPPVSGEDAGAEVEADETDDLAGLRLRLVMQYCEGGPLRKALEAGVFAAAAAPQAISTTASLPGPLRLTPPGPPSTPSLQPQAVASAFQTRLALLGSPLSGAAMLAPQDPVTTAAAAMGWGQPAGKQIMDLVRRTTSSSSQPQPASLYRPWAWEEVAPAVNMPLALRAALDILHGLEYLHDCGVIHGDLTDNNVLLKATKPVLPTQPPPAGVSAAAGGSGAGGLPSAEAALAAMRNAHSMRRFVGGDTAMALAIAQGGPSPGAEPAHLGACPGHRPGHRVRRTSTGAQTRLSQTAWAMDPWRRLPPTAGPAAFGAPTARHEPSSSRNSDGLIKPSTRFAAAAAAAAAASAALPLPSSKDALQAKGSTSSGLVSSTGGPIAQSGGDSECAPPPAGPYWSSNSEAGMHPSLVAHSAVGDPSCGALHYDGTPLEPSDYWVADPSMVGALATAAQSLRFAFKIADFGLSVQLQGGSQTHISGMTQGTPFFAAPEVVQYGRLSPAADIYSFGVVLWLLLHGLSLGQIRHMLPRAVHVPVAPLLLRNASRSLPDSAHAALARALAMDPLQRPKASELRLMVEELLREVAGAELSWLLLSAERREHASVHFI
ncbi:hypothetical protein GPECTOR_18g149 [Gonium pectorale]|uniref:Protein kinase domain-containing protein n=1 Tax=Gonium pectorale TaxID=33097 RepID=A0A150GJL6_GONPE|nr:hypothetical protein GPECTOR_18g149 [Gonium pectorale]|eukprot:KXZ49993.1 hypothetical protein GPECTOR_18g149 [Gonium pectorale]